MNPDTGDVRERIVENADENFTLVRDDVFTYDVFDNYLRPVRRGQPVDLQAITILQCRPPRQGLRAGLDPVPGCSAVLHEGASSGADRTPCDFFELVVASECEEEQRHDHADP